MRMCLYGSVYSIYSISSEPIVIINYIVYLMIMMMVPIPTPSPLSFDGLLLYYSNVWANRMWLDLSHLFYMEAVTMTTGGAVESKAVATPPPFVIVWIRSRPLRAAESGLTKK